MSFNPIKDVYSSHEVDVIGVFHGDDDWGEIESNTITFGFSPNGSQSAGILRDGDVAVVKGQIHEFVTSTNTLVLYRCKIKPVVYQRGS